MQLEAHTQHGTHTHSHVHGNRASTCLNDVVNFIRFNFWHYRPSVMFAILLLLLFGMNEHFYGKQSSVKDLSTHIFCGLKYVDAIRMSNY